ncbi:hypothetical protein [Burkholderia sp. SIMBA_062]|uniref:hypothetical protein n=1 Tax=Burkholderia sp. SIMBA_062 TaxID=3085803 RepID=UPI003979BB1E
MALTNSAINLHDPYLIEWANDNQRKVGDSTTLTAQEELNQRHMTPEATSSLPGKLGTYSIFTAIRRQYRIERNGQPFTDIYINLPMQTKVSVTLETVLGIDRGEVFPVVADKIKETFAAYSFDQHGSVLQYLGVELAKFNSTHTPPLNGSEFDLFTSVTFEWISKQLFDESDRWLHRVFEQDASGAVPDLFKEGQSFRDKGYRLKHIGDTYLNEPPPPKTSTNIIPVQPGVIGDKQHEEAAIDQSTNEPPDGDCQYADDSLKIRITSFSPWRQTMWKWGWMRYGDTHGCSFSMYTLNLYTRKFEYVVYATVKWARPLEALKKIFEDSARDAAEMAAAISIVLDNFEQAVTIFKAEFWRLIQERARQTYECLTPDLKYEEEATSDWEPAGWPDP